MTIPLRTLIANLDPRGEQKLIEEYDDKLGYAEYHQRCRRVLRRKYTGEFSGFEKIPGIDPQFARHIANLLDSNPARLGEFDFRLMIMGNLLTPELDNKLLSYFGSEYLPAWMRFYKNEPIHSVHKAPSFYWHCDGGPSRHLKILVYLNSTEESGGNTLLFDRQVTDAYKRIGYVFCNIKHRTDDITELGNLYGIPTQHTEFQLLPGEALLFEPFYIMHRGRIPTKVPRYMIQICFVPSALYWEQGCLKHKAPVESNKWPNVKLTSA